MFGVWRRVQEILKETPAQVLGDQARQIVIVVQLVQDMVGEQQQAVFKFRNLRMRQHELIGVLKDLIGLVGDEMVADIVLVLKIKIKCSLSNARLIDDIRDGSFGESVLDKEREGRLQEGVAFLKFIIVHFAHAAIPPQIIDTSIIGARGEKCQIKN